MVDINFRQAKVCLSLIFFCWGLLGTSLPGVQARQYSSNTVLLAEYTQNSIKIDGISSEGIWEKAPILKLEVKDGNIGDISINIQAAYDRNRVYFLVRWPDSDKSVLKNAWVFDDNQERWVKKKKKNKPENEIEDEDRFSFLWNIDNSISGFNISGCQVVCHGDRMHTNLPSEKGDLWLWQAARSNFSGYLADKWLGNKVIPGWGPAEVSAAMSGDRDADRTVTENSQTIRFDGRSVTVPRYWKPRAVGGETLFITQEDIDQGKAVKIKEGEKLDRSRIIPGYLLARPAGSRKEVEAQGVWKEGFWTLEISRELTNRHQDDIQFEISKNYRFGVAVTDNSGGFRAYRKGHSFSTRAYTLQFGGIVTEFITKLLFVKDYIVASFGYLKNGKRELAFSELDHAQGILDETEIRLVKADPQRFLKLKRELFEARLNLNPERLLKLELIVREFIQLLKGKIEPSPPSLASQIMGNWIRIQNYILIILGAAAAWLLYTLINILKKKDWQRMGIFLFLFILPIFLEGVGQLGILTGLPGLSHFSFIGNLYARIISVLIISLAILYSQWGFKDLYEAEKKLVLANKILDEKVQERTKEMSIILDTTNHTIQMSDIKKTLQFFSEMLIYSFSFHTLCRVAIMDKSKEDFEIIAVSSIRRLGLESQKNQTFSLKDFPTLKKILAQGRVELVPASSDLPDGPEKDFLALDKFNMVILIPFKGGDNLLGFALLNEERQQERKTLSRENINFYQTLANHLSMSINNSLLFSQKHDLFLNTVKALAAAIDARDSYTHYHSRNVTEYAAKIAKAMNFTEEELTNLKTAAILHDIGKIGIKDEILLKPGKLTREEFQEIKTHPGKSVKILESVDALKPVVAIVAAHHERYDGGGYPKGVKGKEIPLGARIIAVADAFDAMTTSRVYRTARDIQYAIEEITEHAGTQFDPEVVEAFKEVVSQFVGQTYEI